MSRPDEEAESIRRAARLLWALTDPRMTPRVPTAIRKAAREALRHYPGLERTAGIFAALPVADAAEAWWVGKRPCVYNAVEHLENPAVNTVTDGERELARAVARRKGATK